MPLQLEEYKAYNATMNILYPSMPYLSHEAFRKVCDTVGDNSSEHRLVTNWPSQEWIDMAKWCLQNGMPDDLGKPGHRYYQTAPEAANFKHFLKNTYEVVDGFLCRKSGKRQCIISRDYAYGMICEAHVDRETGAHKARDETYKTLVELGLGSAASKTQIEVFIKECSHPTCRNNQKAGSTRKRSRNDEGVVDGQPSSKKAQPQPTEVRKQLPSPVSPDASKEVPRPQKAVDLGMYADVQYPPLPGEAEKQLPSPVSRDISEEASQPQKASEPELFDNVQCPPDPSVHGPVQQAPMPSVACRNVEGSPMPANNWQRPSQYSMDTQEIADNTPDNAADLEEEQLPQEPSSTEFFDEAMYYDETSLIDPFLLGQENLGYYTSPEGMEQLNPVAMSEPVPNSAMDAQEVVSNTPDSAAIPEEEELPQESSSAKFFDEAMYYDETSSLDQEDCSYWTTPEATERLNQVAMLFS